MGVDKSMLPVGGRPLIAYIADQLTFFPERLIGSNDPDKHAFLGLPVVPDEAPGHGPLMGILSCVERATHELCFVTGCDIPTLDHDFILELLAQADGHDAVMPRFRDGRVEPLVAVYRKTVVPVARALVARGIHRVLDVQDHLRVCFVAADSLGWYCNLNTVEDYHRWLAASDVGRPEQL
jgi:molybdopterin-guanine dinucleotide biosynthesis protein A